MKSILLLVFVFALLVPVALGDMDNVFLILDTEDPGPVSPGETFDIEFTLRNYDLDELEVVTAYIDPCPDGWECEELTLAYEFQGDHPENISVMVPEHALTKIYTIYIKLSSDWDVVRGDDRVLINVIPAAHEVKPRDDVSKALKTEPVDVIDELADEVNETESIGMLDVVEDVLPIINASDVKQNVERLQTSKQFVEYATVVLIITLVFIVGAVFVAFGGKKVVVEKKKIKKK